MAKLSHLLTQPPAPQWDPAPFTLACLWRRFIKQPLGTGLWGDSRLLMSGVVWCRGCGSSVWRLGWVQEAGLWAGAGRGGGCGEAGPWSGCPVSALPGTDTLSLQDFGAVPRGSGRIMGLHDSLPPHREKPGRVRALMSYCSPLPQSKCPVCAAACDSGPASERLWG